MEAVLRYVAMRQRQRQTRGFSRTSDRIRVEAARYWAWLSSMQSKQSKQVREYLKVEQIFGSKRSVQYAIGVSFRARQTLSRGEPLGVCKKGRVNAAD